MEEPNGYDAYLAAQELIETPPETPSPSPLPSLDLE
jgi:hypothetical protein